MRALSATSYLLIFVFALSGCTPSGERAIEECKNLVKNRLKAPATASFTNISVEDLDEKTSNIDGDVDAENSFGAKIRSSFSCQVYEDGSVKLLYLSE